MASKKDVIRLTDEDFKEKKYKTAPGGKYGFVTNKKSKVEPSKHSDHNNLLLILNIPKGKHKGTQVRDYISAKTPWKVVHLLKALGLSEKKAKALAKKGITLAELLKMALKADEIRAVIGEDKYNGKPQNNIVQYLPPASEDDDDEEEEDDSEEEDEDEDEDDEEEDEDEDSDEEDDEEDSDEDDEDDEDEEEDDEEEDDDDDDEEEDEDDEEEDDDAEEEDEDDDEEEVKPKRRTAKKKTAARGKKKPAKKKGGRKTTRGKKK